MTATAIETSALEALDFDITCQTVRAFVIGGVKLAEQPWCYHPATHSASIHQDATCEVIDKFICEACIPRIRAGGCSKCGKADRISNLVPLPKTS